MHHCVRHLDAGGPAIAQHTVDLGCSRGDEARGIRLVGSVQVQRRGQLTLEFSDDRQHRLHVRAPQEDRGRAEHLMRKRRIAAEPLGVRSE